jgi:hypothetical protein
MRHLQTFIKQNKLFGINPRLFYFTVLFCFTTFLSFGQVYTFNYTGAVQTWVVPAGVTSVQIEASGAQGNSNASGVVGGKGGKVTGDLAVTPGTTLYIYVGGGGAISNAGGFNGGGNGGNTTCAAALGGGGGGASDVRVGTDALATRVLVAAGGGGAAGNRVATCGRGGGGGGGGGYYGGGGGAGWPAVSIILPTGGTQTTGGTKGTSTFVISIPVTNNSGGDGGLGFGGIGGNEIGSNQAGNTVAASGGAGGGLIGTDGSYNSNFSGQSGAGGSSYIGGVSNGITNPNIQVGNGLVKITATAETITTTGTLTAFTTCVGTPSVAQNYTVSGVNLAANITINAPIGYEISQTSATTGFAATQTLTQTLGNVGNTTIFVRLTGATAGTPAGNVANSSGTATTQNIAVTGTVDTLPTITGLSAANVASGSTTFNLVYTSTTGTPNQYSITTGGTAMAGFAAVTNAGLTASPLVITIPASATAGTYDFNLTLRNSTTGCVSAVVPFTLTVTALPTTIYVNGSTGNDTNDGLSNANPKLTVQNAFTTVADGNIVVLNAGTYNETATLTNKSITLQSVGNPTVQTIILNGTGKTVTLTGGLNISEILNLQAGDLASAGNLTLLASAAKQAMLIQGTGTNVTGNVNVQRYLRANAGTGGTTSLGYRFVSSPTSNATLTQLSELNPVVNAAFNGAAFPGRTVPFPTVYSYNPTLAGDPAKTFITSPFPEFDKGWVSPATLGENMNVGQGFTVNTSANQVLEITGLLNNGNVNIPVVVGNAASLGYNLVGNPYPSPIKWSDVLAASSNVNNAIYQNMATGQYTGAWASYVGGVGVNGATDDIAVMQGFFVIANAAGSVNFTNATRATTYTNPNSFRTEDDTNNNKNASKNNGLLRLAMTNAANKTDETVVYFADKATANFDKELDAVKFQLNGGNFPNIYTTDNKTEKNTLFSINALPTLNDDLLVPVTLQSWNGGVQKIAMTEKLNFTREVQVFLKDKSTNTLHDFSKGAFEFTATSGVLANRFELVFKPQFTAAELQGDNLNVYPNPSSEVLNISIGDDYKGELTLRLIDVTGREVWATKAEKTSKIYENSVNLSNFASGTYILEVSGAKKMVKKVVKN